MRASIVIALAATLFWGGAAFADWESGVTAFRSGEFDTAMEMFTAVVDRNPSFAGGFFMLGLTLQRLDRHEEAIVALGDASRLDPGNAQYAVAAARALLEAERLEEAEAVLASLDPEGIEPDQYQLVLVTRALIARAGGDQGRVLDLLGQAAELVPDNADIMSHYAQALARAGRNLEAFEAFRRAWEVNRSESAGRNAYAAGIRAAREAATEGQRTDLFRWVAELAAEAYEASPSSANALLVGEAYLGAAKYDSALAWFERIDEESALALMYKGQAHASLGQLAKAEETLRRAAQLESDSELLGQIRNSLGFVLDMARKYAEAARVYQQAGNTAKVAEMREKERLAQRNIEAAEEEERIRELQRLLREYAEIDRRGPAPTPAPR